MHGRIEFLALFAEALDSEFFKHREELVEYELYSFFIAVKIGFGILRGSLEIIDNRENLIDYVGF